MQEARTRPVHCEIVCETELGDLEAETSKIQVDCTGVKVQE